MTEPLWLDERKARTWDAFLTGQRELLSVLEKQVVRDSGLSGAEYAVLVPLSESSEGLLRARELGSDLGWDRSRLSHQVSRMEKRGLVAREECPTDARGAMVRITAAGRSAVESAAPGHVTAVRRYFLDLLSDEELDLLSAVFERVLAGLPDEKI